jgi:FtsZ-binding cell division protein ZapB
MNRQRSLRWRHLHWTCLDRLRFGSLIVALTLTGAAAAQKTAEVVPESKIDSATESIRDLRLEVKELQEAVDAMRADWKQSRAETAELRREVEELRGSRILRATSNQGVHETAFQNAGLLTAAAPAAYQSENQSGDTQSSDAPTPDLQTTAAQRKAARLEEEYQLLSGKVDDQYQTKVESASRYRVRLSGIVLMNLFSNQGVVDSIDIPTVAYASTPGYSNGSFGASLRQSEIGLETFGPTIAGAKTSADLQLDFAGGFPSVPNGINYGLVRLRTATMRMDWANTSVIVGQDSLFISPNSPTSFASLAVPALTYAGNLWSWSPQIRVEHRFNVSADSNISVQAGILDPLTGEIPNASSSSSYYREAGPGEASRQPAYATRVAWNGNAFGRPFSIGAAGYYSRQDYGNGQNVDGWAGMTDIDVPVSSKLSFSGKFYRGRAIGGLYAAFGQSVLFSGDPATPPVQVQPLNSMGGWAQLKYRPVNKWEFNAAFGIDNPFASDLKYFPYPFSYGNAALARNQGSFINMIYRPRSDLLFSAEYRRLLTYSFVNGGNSAGQVNLMMGVLF